MGAGASSRSSVPGLNADTRSCERRESHRSAFRGAGCRDRACGFFSPALENNARAPLTRRRHGVNLHRPGRTRRVSMTNGKPIQLILARQLASSVAMPILLVDTEGTLVYFNEPAEGIIGSRFEEIGELRTDEFNDIVAVVDENRKPLAPEERPLRAALIGRRPVSRTLWTKGPAGVWRHVQVTAFPLIGEAEHLLGAMLILSEI
jgi:PAS domain-containing protein